MSVRCQVKTMLWPVSPNNITGTYRAKDYINSVGWDHVSSGLCSNTKCLQAKKFIDYGLIGKLSTNKTFIAKAMSMWSLEFKISQGSIQKVV